jgi:hypothetical protein
MDLLDIIWLIIAIPFAFHVERQKRSRPNVFGLMAANLGLTALADRSGRGMRLEGRYRGHESRVECDGAKTSLAIVVRVELPEGLRLVRESAVGKWPGEQDIEVGASGFDRALVIQGKDEEAIAGLLALPALRESLLRFFARNPEACFEERTLRYHRDREPEDADELEAWLDEGVAVANAFEQAIAGDPIFSKKEEAELAEARARRKERKQLVRRARWRRLLSLLAGLPFMGAGFFLAPDPKDEMSYLVYVLGGMAVGVVVMTVTYRCPRCGAAIRPLWNNIDPAVCSNCGTPLR